MMNKLKYSLRNFFVFFYALILCLFSFGSGATINAAGPSNARPDRWGDVFGLNDSDFSFQARFADYYPELEGLRVVDINAANQSYYVLQNGDVWAYRDSSGSYTKVTTLSGVKSIVSSTEYTYFALKTDGTVWSWGCTQNILGRDATNQGDCSDNSVGQIDELSGITKIAAGYNHVLALKSDGTIWAWGDNYYGNVGTDANVSDTTHGGEVSRPIQVSLPGAAVSVAAGSSHSLALLSDGSLYEWGQLAQYPFNTWQLNPTPVLVSSLGNVVAITDDANAAFAVKSDGQVWAWGRNDSNQLLANNSSLPIGGDGVPYTLIPIQITGLPLLQEMQSDNHSAFIGRSMSDDLWVWGNNLTESTNVPNTQGVGAYYYSRPLIQFVSPLAPQLLSITASPSIVSIDKGAQQQLAVTARYSDSTTEDITSQAMYSSSNASVASVDANGNITGNSVGNATLTISLNGKTTSVDVTVNPTAPQPPINLSLVNGNGARKLNLSWSAPADNGGSAITNYLVFRRTGSDPFTQVASVTSTSFTDSGLTTGTTYEYYVKAVNSIGSSVPSVTVSKQAPGAFGNPVCIFPTICI